MFLKQIALAATALLASCAASAQIGVTADLGSTGAGLHVVVPMEDNLNGRFGVNYFKHDFDKRSSGLAYDIKGKLQTIDILFDWYALRNSQFHLTGGLVYNGNRFDARARPDATGHYVFDSGENFTAADVGAVTGRVSFRKAAPYLGIGWGNVLTESGRWSVNADLGAFYQGHANVQLGNADCAINALVCKMLANDLAAAQARLGDDVSKYKVYPVLRAGVGYRF